MKPDKFTDLRQAHAIIWNHFWPPEVGVRSRLLRNGTVRIDCSGERYTIENGSVVHYEPPTKEPRP